MEKINKKKVFAGFKFVGDGREVLRQWMVDARGRYKYGPSTKPLIISGPMASGKTTLIRRIVEYYKGEIFDPRLPKDEYSFLWKFLDIGGLCAFDDWGGRGCCMYDFMRNVYDGGTHRRRRLYSTFEVDEYFPNGRVVVALSALARKSVLSRLQSFCAFVQLQNLITTTERQAPEALDGREARPDRQPRLRNAETRHLKT